jgi:hypothetical protein
MTPCFYSDTAPQFRPGQIGRDWGRYAIKQRYCTRSGIYRCAKCGHRLTMVNGKQSPRALVVRGTVFSLWSQRPTELGLLRQLLEARELIHPLPRGSLLNAILEPPPSRMFSHRRMVC